MRPVAARHKVPTTCHARLRLGVQCSLLSFGEHIVCGQQASRELKQRWISKWRHDQSVVRHTCMSGSWLQKQGLIYLTARM